MTKPSYIHSFALSEDEEQVLRYLRLKKVKIIDIVKRGLDIYKEEYEDKA